MAGAGPRPAARGAGALVTGRRTARPPSGHVDYVLRSILRQIGARAPAPNRLVPSPLCALPCRAPQQQGRTTMARPCVRPLRTPRTNSLSTFETAPLGWPWASIPIVLEEMPNTLTTHGRRSGPPTRPPGRFAAIFLPAATLVVSAISPDFGHACRLLTQFKHALRLFFLGPPLAAMLTLTQDVAGFAASPGGHMGRLSPVPAWVLNDRYRITYSFSIRSC